MGLYALVFEVLVIIFYGAFIRIDATAVSTGGVSSMLYFVVGTILAYTAYTVMSLKGRNQDWAQMVNYLFTLAVTFQISLLYYLFWLQAFLKQFNSTSSITSNNLVVGMECVFTALFICRILGNRLEPLHLFLLTQISAFGFILNYAISQFGFFAITGGGGIIMFSYAASFTIPIIWVNFKETSRIAEPQRHWTSSVKLLALLVLIMLWPSFNSAMAAPDLAMTSLTSGSLLAEQAFIQTVLCLFSAIITSLSIRIYGEKVILNDFIQSIVGSGILISSSASVIIDPFSSLFLGMLWPVASLLIQKYLPSIKASVYPWEVLILGILSSIMSAIFCAGRNGRTPTLATNSLLQGGLQLASLIITLLFGTLFGFIAGYVLKFAGITNKKIEDNRLFIVDSDSIPLYPDDEIIKKVLSEQEQKVLNEQKGIKREDFFTLTNGYVSETRNPQLPKVPRLNEGQDKDPMKSQIKPKEATSKIQQSYPVRNTTIQR